MAELGVEPGQHGSEPVPIGSTPHCYTLHWDMGAGTELGVTVRRSLSLSLALLHSMFPLGEVGREASPSAWGSQAQDTRGRICRAGLGKARGRGRGIFQKIPPSPQALLSLLSKSLAFLEVKDSAAEELVRPVCVPRNQARVKLLEGVGAVATCSPVRQLRAALLRDTRPAGPASAWLHEDTGWPVGKAGGAPCSSGGETGSPSFAHSFLRPSDSCPLTPTLFQGPDAISSAYHTHLGSGWGTQRDRRHQWPRAKKSGGEWGTSREAIGGSKTLASASLGVFHSIACSGPLPLQLGLIGDLGCP